MVWKINKKNFLLLTDAGLTAEATIWFDFSPTACIIDRILLCIWSYQIDSCHLEFWMAIGQTVLEISSIWLLEAQNRFQIVENIQNSR